MNPVVVTAPEFAKAATVFANAPGFRCLPAPSDEAGLAAAIRRHDARFAIVGVERYRDDLYEALPRGGVIARFGVGHDGIDKARAADRGILCCNTPGVLDDSVAECAIGLMLATARHLAAADAAVRAGTWRPRIGTELAGRRLAIIGCGGIGRRVAAIARHGFGMRIHGCSPRDPADRGWMDAFSRDFASAVADADIVSVHIPDRPDTRDFINRECLACMPAPAILINTARGGVLDEDALYDAVSGGRIAGAGLDVFKAEPYVPRDPGRDLRTLDRIVMTPHIGSSTREACERMAHAALANLGHAVHGRIGAMSLLPRPT